MSILLLNSLIKAQQNFNLHFYLLFSSMKSGKIFASVALAALTAACTQESMQFEAAPGLQNRPTVNVELGFDESAVELGSEETRAFFGKPAGQGYQWIFEEGDKIGALLMDEWNGNGCGINNFTIKDYVHTNYAFIRETQDGETKWVTPAQAPVCEGNYFFYFPYNDTFNHRGYVGWDVNPVQPQYNENGELFQMQTVKENQKWIGYKYVGHELEGKVNKVNFDFVPLFAMPTFDIINKAGELTVNKVVVRVTSNDDAEINPSGTHELMATTMVLAPESGNFDQVNKTWDSKNFAEHTSLMYKHAQRYTKFGEEDYVWPIGIDVDEDGYGDSWSWNAKGKNLFPLNENHTDESIRKEATYEYVADYSGVEGGYKVEQFGHIQALLVMPAGYYYWNQGRGQKTFGWGSGQTFEALIYVTTKQGDDYVVRIDLGRPQTQGSTSGSNFDDVNSGAAPKFLAPGVNTKFLAEFDATAMQSYDITDFKAVSSEDLKWLIEESEANQGYYDLNVTTSGSRVVLTKEIEELLAARPKVRLHINGEITIAADASEDAINKLYFDNDNMYTKLNILNKQVKKAEPIYAEVNDEIVGYSNVLGNCEINVAKGGELDTKTNKIDIEADVNNEGTVTAQNIKGEVVNKGTMTADKITGPVTNSGNLTAKIIEGTVNNSGTITINEKVTKKVTNSGTATIANAEDVIENNGTMKLTGATYKKDVTNNKTMEVNGVSTFKALLTNNKNAEITFNRAATCEDTFTNSGKATMKANVTVSSENKAINQKDAKIKVEKGVKFIGDDNTVYSIENYGLIENDGETHNVFNAGKIVTGSDSYTAVVKKETEDAEEEGNGTIDNSKLGAVSYEADNSQIVQLIIEDITGTSISDLNDMIEDADATYLQINNGTIEAKANEYIKGHTADNEINYFKDGVVLGNVVVSGKEKTYAVFCTDGMTIKTQLLVSTKGEMVVIKESETGTTLTVNGTLNVADHALLRGGTNAKLDIVVNGKVHNAGIIKNINNVTDTNNGWTGNAYQ